jgi:hypothetical protein
MARRPIQPRPVMRGTMAPGTGRTMHHESMGTIRPASCTLTCTARTMCVRPGKVSGTLGPSARPLIRT